MLFFNKLTDTSLIPGSLPTLFSILAEQAEQVMPVMSNCSFCKIIPSFSIIFLRRSTPPLWGTKNCYEKGLSVSWGKDAAAPVTKSACKVIDHFSL